MDSLRGRNQTPSRTLGARREGFRSRRAAIAWIGLGVGGWSLAFGLHVYAIIQTGLAEPTPFVTAPATSQSFPIVVGCEIEIERAGSCDGIPIVRVSGPDQDRGPKP